MYFILYIIINNTLNNVQKNSELIVLITNYLFVTENYLFSSYKLVLHYLSM